MKNKIKNISKTILSSIVIFNMVFATAAMPVVAFAFEEEIQSAQNEVAAETKEETKEESKEESNVEVSETTDETETVKDETSTTTEEDSTTTDEPATPEDTTTVDESSGSNGGDNEGLVAGVSSPERLAVVDATGVITVCKLIVDADGNIVDGSQFPNETFTIPFDDASVVFDTDTFVPNTVFGATDRFNAECRRHEGLPFGIYNYGAEVTSGPTEWKVTYTEGDIASIDGGYSYGAESLSDGVIDLGGQNLLTDVTLYVINQEEASSCPEGVISARIKFSKLSNGAQVQGWRNWGTGDVAPKVYVGGNTPAHQYDDEEWFPLTNPDGSFINDPDIESYRDVEGLAVQRMEGKVRVVLFGFHDVVDKKTGPLGPSQQPEGPVEYSIDGAEGKEFTQFVLELSHDGFGAVDSMISPLSWSNDISNPRIHDPMINDAANPMDSRGTHISNYDEYINQYNPRFDRMRTISEQKVASVLVVTTGSDGFYASYDIDPNSEEDCNSGEDDPQINLPSIGCIETSVLYFDYLAGVTVTDDEGAGNVTLTYDASGVMLGTVGEYVVTYTAVDSDGNIDEEIRTINIQVDCDNGNGGSAPKLTIPGPLCIETDLMTFDFMAGVSATDDEGPGNVTITNDSEFSVDLGTNGVYTVTYKATDSDGNQVEKTRIVYIKENCGNGPVGELPVITISGQSCIETSAVSFDFAAGVSASDAEDGNITSNVNYDSSAVIFGTAGVYVVTYDITDSDNNTVEVNRIITISADCPDNGGDGEFPGLSFNGQSCIDSSVTSYDFMSGVTVTDNEGAGNVTVTNNSASSVTLGTVGTYTVTYTATDSDGNVTIKTRNFTVSEDCSTGGNGNHPVIVVGSNSCMTTEATSYNFMGSVGASDVEDGMVPVTVDSSAVVYGVVGTYKVIYSATDSDGNTTTLEKNFSVSVDCDSTGGGSDQDPTISTGGQACVLTGATGFDFMNGVTANDAEDGDLTSSIVLDGEETVIFGTNGTYTVSYSVTDSLAQTTTVTRTIVIAENCDDNGGGGGGNGGGGNGGGSSSGSSRRGAGGEVLGADIGPSCIRFTEYHDTGDTGGEIRALQVFLNEYMNAGLTVDGVYSVATTQAVHDFQAMHWDDIIDPWTPPLSPNTTGREYKTTRATINAIMDCPEVAVYLEDPGTMFEITEVKSQKTFTEDQIAKVVAELAN